MRYVLCASFLLVVPVVFADSTPTLKEGDRAPEINLPATLLDSVAPGKKTFSLKDARGKNVVLFFYPKAMTPGCTRECKGFTKLKDEFAKANTIAIGISTDRLTDQEKFMARDSLAIPLLADPDLTAARAYGVLRGKIANRVTFIIDKGGVVRRIYNPANADKNPAEALKYVQEELR